MLGGAKALLNSGLLNDIEEMIGIHLRPIQEAGMGQATPALCHGASYVVKAKVKGLASHGARPHLGINAIDAAAQIVNAVNAVKLNPTIPYSVKTTKLVAGGTAHNIIPDTAEMTFDLRAQTNEAMKELLEKTTNAIKQGAMSIGAEAEVSIVAGVPAADYNEEMIALAKKAIETVASSRPHITPEEDFHYYSTKGRSKPLYWFWPVDHGLHSTE